MSKKFKILITIGAYIPGYKFGGPVRSIYNIIQCFGHELEFYILTSDRDLGDTSQYKDIKLGEWNEVGNAFVRYLTPQETQFFNLVKIIKDINYDLLYMNSFFASWPTIYLLVARRFGLISKCPALLAPRGEFSPGAISKKRIKKRLFIMIAKSIGLTNNIKWHASTRFEAADIHINHNPPKNDVYIASNLTQSPSEILPVGSRDFDVEMHIAFLSRISPKKNLLYALDILHNIKSKIIFNIYGPVEDITYWRRCEQKISGLPKNIYVRYIGTVNPSDVPNILRNNDLLFLPTEGENFGHVIAESLAVGTPVLISDRTPWRCLEERHFGAEFDLTAKEKFVNYIEHSAETDPANRLKYRKRTFSSFKNYFQNLSDVIDNKNMFNRILEEIKK